ncbi:hypothetical protein ABYF34_08200 [Buchananella felis]|uniref:hypothetical protein n=1 Tax=Buchananella felis TaxID=3231492 RepID=UPI0035276AA0
METYSAALDRVQTDTLNALYAARQAKWERDEARDNQRYYQDLADDYANTDDEGGFGHDQWVRYTNLAQNAGTEAVEAQDRIDNQVQVAQNAVQERDQAAQTAIDAIQRATTTDGLNDGRWEDYGAKLLGWIADLAQAIAQFAGILAMALCWIPVLGPALAVIAAIAGIVEAVANIGLAIGGEKSWGEALLSVGFAALGCIGLGGLRGAVSSLKALKNFGGALKTAGGLKGAFLTFAKSAIPPGARCVAEVRAALTHRRQQEEPLRQGQDPPTRNQGPRPPSIKIPLRTPVRQTDQESGRMESTVPNRPRRVRLQVDQSDRSCWKQTTTYP